MAVEGAWSLQAPGCFTANVNTQEKGNFLIFHVLAACPGEGPQSCSPTSLTLVQVPVGLTTGVQQGAH